MLIRPPLRPVAQPIQGVACQRRANNGAHVKQLRQQPYNVRGVHVYVRVYVRVYVCVRVYVYTWMYMCVQVCEVCVVCEGNVRLPVVPFMARRNPSPSRLKRLPEGIVQSSNKTMRVGCEFQPS